MLLYLKSSDVCWCAYGLLIVVGVGHIVGWLLCWLLFFMILTVLDVWNCVVCYYIFWKCMLTCVDLCLVVGQLY